MKKRGTARDERARMVVVGSPRQALQEALDPEGKLFLQMHKRAVSACSSRQSSHKLPWQTQASEVHAALKKREWKPTRIGRSQHRRTGPASGGSAPLAARYRPASAVSRLQTGNSHSRNTMRLKFDRPQSAGYNAPGKRRNLAVHPALLPRSRSPTPVEAYSDSDDFVQDEDADGLFEDRIETTMGASHGDTMLSFEMIASPLSLSASIPQ
jgi:hypothetical protein